MSSNLVLYLYNAAEAGMKQERRPCEPLYHLFIRYTLRLHPLVHIPCPQKMNPFEFGDHSHLNLPAVLNLPVV